MSTRFFHIVIFLFSSLWLVGCKTQPTTNTNTSQSVLSKTDTLYLERTLPIHDTLYLPVPSLRTTNPNCDSLCQQALSNALAHLATHKTSGNNSYGLYYNKYRQQLVLYQQLQEQINSHQSSTSSQQHTIIQKEQIPTPYIPLPIKILAYIGAAALAYCIIRIYIAFRK